MFRSHLPRSAGEKSFAGSTVIGWSLMCQKRSLPHGKMFETFKKNWFKMVGPFFQIHKPIENMTNFVVHSYLPDDRNFNLWPFECLANNGLVPSSQKSVCFFDGLNTRR